MTDMQREFEAWATSKGMNLTKSHDGTYVYRPAFYAFMGWSHGLNLSFHQRVYLEDQRSTTQAVNSVLDMNDI